MVEPIVCNTSGIPGLSILSSSGFYGFLVSMSDSETFRQEILGLSQVS